MVKNYTVSVIVPAYNEEKTVYGVVESLLASKQIDEVICVDDGSSDDTYQTLKKFGSKIKLVHYLENKGKGHALYCGVKKAKGEIVVFCDSDLIGLSEDDIMKMVKALLVSNKKMVIGIPKGKGTPYSYIQSLTGERAFYKKDLLPLLDHIKVSRFGVETYLNHIFKKPSVIKISAYHLLKSEKMNSKDAFMSYLRETIEIVREYARLEGFLNEKFEQQLKSINRAKTWRQLGVKLRDVGNSKVKNIFKKHIVGYSRRIKSFFTE